jgi:hypothetical protein
MKIDVNGVSITLTQEQLEEIAKQTKLSKFLSYKDIKMYNDACLLLNISNAIPDFASLNGFDSTKIKRHVALFKLENIAKAIRSFTQWKPDWNNANQYKYQIRFNLKGGCSCYVNSYVTDSSVPSALALGTYEEAVHFGIEFLDLFKDLYTE